MNTESFNNHDYYFWCVLKKETSSFSNCGHGWSKDYESAAIDAFQYYYNIIKKEDIKVDTKSTNH